MVQIQITESSKSKNSLWSNRKCLEPSTFAQEIGKKINPSKRDVVVFVFLKAVFYEQKNLD